MKVIQSSPKILPEVVIYDVDLTMTAAMSGTSGMNVIAHPVAALYARENTPVISPMAGEAIGALASGVRRQCPPAIHACARS